MRAIRALLADTSRANAVLTVIGCNSHYGAVPSIVRRAVATITSMCLHFGTVDSVLTMYCVCIDPHGGATMYSTNYLQALFSLLSAVVSISAGAAALNTSGVIAALVPLLTYTSNNPYHLKVGILLCTHFSQRATR
jgi:hypothetical protein